MTYFYHFGRMVFLPQLCLEYIGQQTILHFIISRLKSLSSFHIAEHHFDSNGLAQSAINIQSRSNNTQKYCAFLQHFLLANKIIMLNYSPVHPARVNPEFIGVATKYGTIKKNRTALQQDKNELMRRLKYRVSVDRHLEKSLLENKSKLRTVRSIHRRHQDQLEDKRSREERHRRDLINLNRTVQMTREQQRQSIKDALSRTHTRNRQSRQHTGHMQSLIANQLRSTQLGRLEEKRLRFKEIKLVERDSQQTVHQFYRERNTGSLNQYQMQIDEEKSKYMQCVEEIKKIESSIDHYDGRIGKKKELLVEVMDQISLYTLEPLQTQGRCLPLYLRDTMSTSVHSSKPSEILLKGPKNIMSREQS